MILNSGKDAAILKSFMGFLSFRSGATVCLPLQAGALDRDEDNYSIYTPPLFPVALFN